MNLGELILALAAAGFLGVILLAILARLNGRDDDADDGHDCRFDDHRPDPDRIVGYSLLALAIFAAGMLVGAL